jgi:peptidoglycan hydrolase CwlO-like protein
METEILQTWKAEIEAEVIEAAASLTSATEALAAAVTARDVARAEHLKVAAIMGDLVADHSAAARYFGQPHAGFPAAIARRAHPTEQALHRAEGAVTHAKQEVENAQHAVDDLTEALTRIARAVARAAGEEVAAQ